MTRDFNRFRQRLGPVQRRVGQRDVRRHSGHQQSDEETRRLLHVRGEQRGRHAHQFRHSSQRAG